MDGMNLSGRKRRAVEGAFQVRYIAFHGVFSVQPITSLRVVLVLGYHRVERKKTDTAAPEGGAAARGNVDRTDLWFSNSDRGGSRKHHLSDNSSVKSPFFLRRFGLVFGIIHSLFPCSYGCSLTLFPMKKEISNLDVVGQLLVKRVINSQTP